jgi:hypothetical protein
MPDQVPAGNDQLLAGIRDEFRARETKHSMVVLD